MRWRKRAVFIQLAGLQPRVTTINPPRNKAVVIRWRKAIFEFIGHIHVFDRDFHIFTAVNARCRKVRVILCIKTAVAVFNWNAPVFRANDFRYLGEIQFFIRCKMRFKFFFRRRSLRRFRYFGDFGIFRDLRHLRFAFFRNYCFIPRCLRDLHAAGDRLRLYTRQICNAKGHAADARNYQHSTPDFRP